MNLVKGRPTLEELAAVVAVVSARAAAAAAAAERGERGQVDAWRDHARNIRRSRAPQPGPHAWRKSALPV